jgi:alpha-1,2-mannosyltransferase
MATRYILACISIVPLLPFLGAFILRFLLRVVGNRLRRKTSGKRDVIFQRVRTEKRQLQSDLPATSKRDDDDWERVESSAAGTARNGDSYRERDFEGVIGFFHPFWYGKNRVFM